MTIVRTPRRKEPSHIASQADATESSSQPNLPSQPNSVLGHSGGFIDPEQRHAMIAEAAYYRAQHRSFEPGHELEDWCVAEGEIDATLTRGEIRTARGI